MATFSWVDTLYSGLYYKHTTIVNYTSSIVNKLEALLTDDARVVIDDRLVFIVQATDDQFWVLITQVIIIYWKILLLEQRHLHGRN